MSGYEQIQDISWCADHNGVIDEGSTHCDLHIADLHGDGHCQGVAVYRKVAA